MMKLFKRQPKPIEYASLDDPELVSMAQANDKEAFGELYARYVKQIYNYIYYRTGNQHDAEDLTAKVFFRAMSHIESYVDRGVPFSAWLYRIAHNLVANWHRDRGRQKIVPLDEYIASNMRSASPEHIVEDNDQQDQLLQAIRRLPEERQQLLLLKFIDNLSNAEIGVILGRSEGAIKSLYHRTLQSLKDDFTLQEVSGQYSGEESESGRGNT